MAGGVPDQLRTVAVHAARPSTTPDKLAAYAARRPDTIVAKALKEGPAERYASVTALADDLLRWLSTSRSRRGPTRCSTRRGSCAAIGPRWRWRRWPSPRRSRESLALSSGADCAPAARLTMRTLYGTQTHDEFLEFLRSPMRRRRKPFTVNDLLVRGERMERSPALPATTRRVPDRSDDLDRQDYLAQDDDASAPGDRGRLRALAQGVRSVPPRHRLVRRWFLSRDQQLERAEQMVRRSARIARRIRNSPSIKSLGCLRAQQVAQARGRLADRDRAPDPGAADAAWFGHPFRRGGAALMTDLASLYSTAGRDGEAVRAFRAARRLLTALGRDETQGAVVLFNNWALELEQLGRPLSGTSPPARHRHQPRGRDRGKFSPRSQQLRPLFARAGRVDEGGRATPSAPTPKRSSPTTSWRSANRCWSGRGSTASGAISHARRRCWRRSRPRLRESLPPGHYAFAALVSGARSWPWSRAIFRPRRASPIRRWRSTRPRSKAGGEGVRSICRPRWCVARACSSPAGEARRIGGRARPCRGPVAEGRATRLALEQPRRRLPGSRARSRRAGQARGSQGGISVRPRKSRNHSGPGPPRVPRRPRSEVTRDRC